MKKTKPNYKCGSDCEKCQERFSCWTSRSPKIASLTRELETVRAEKEYGAFQPRITILEKRERWLSSKIVQLEQLKINSMKQENPPILWVLFRRVGMIADERSSRKLDQKLHFRVDNKKFVARVPKRVMEIYTSTCKTHKKEEIFVVSNTPKVFWQWDIMFFEAKLFLYEDNTFFLLATWGGKGED